MAYITLAIVAPFCNTQFTHSIRKLREVFDFASSGPIRASLPTAIVAGKRKGFSPAALELYPLLCSLPAECTDKEAQRSPLQQMRFSAAAGEDSSHKCQCEAAV